MTGSVTEYRVPEMDGREVFGGVGVAGGPGFDGREVCGGVGGLEARI